MCETFAMMFVHCWNDYHYWYTCQCVCPGRVHLKRDLNIVCLVEFGVVMCSPCAIFAILTWKFVFDRPPYGRTAPKKNGRVSNRSAVHNSNTEAIPEEIGVLVSGLE